jgi:hypothetical protein
VAILFPAVARRRFVPFEMTVMGHRDPLGKVLKVYRPNTAASVMIAILMCVAGGGALLYCQFHQPYPYKIMLAGVVLLVLGPVMAAVSLFNSRRSLEIRRHGVRLVDGQNATEGGRGRRLVRRGFLDRHEDGAVGRPARTRQRAACRGHSFTCPSQSGAGA